VSWEAPPGVINTTAAPETDLQNLASQFINDPVQFVWGGVPAMRNMVELKDCLSEAYVNSPTAVAGAEPVVPFHEEIPVLTTQVYPCHEVVKMDYFIPGCPPSPDAIFKVFDDLINGRPVDLPVSLNQYAQQVNSLQRQRDGLGTKPKELFIDIKTELAKFP